MEDNVKKALKESSETIIGAIAVVATEAVKNLIEDGTKKESEEKKDK